MKKRLLCTCLLLLTPLVAVLANTSQAQTLDVQEHIILSHITSGRAQEAK